MTSTSKGRTFGVRDLFHRRGAEAATRVDVLRWRLFPVSAGEQVFFVFLDGKTPGEAVNVSRMFARDATDSFPGWRYGTVKILAARIHTSQA